MIEASPHIKAWRANITAVATAARTADGWTAADGPVEVHLTFHLPRPKGHYGTGRNSDALREAAPRWPLGKPDIDKLSRACLDGIVVAGVLPDDSQVVILSARKVWAVDGPGVAIHVYRI